MLFCQLGDFCNVVNKNTLKRQPKALLMGFCTVNNALGNKLNHTSGAL